MPFWARFLVVLVATGMVAWGLHFAGHLKHSTQPSYIHVYHPGPPVQ